MVQGCKVDIDEVQNPHRCTLQTKTYQKLSAIQRPHYVERGLRRVVEVWCSDQGSLYQKVNSQRVLNP
jgi:hypothetical protein